MTGRVLPPTPPPSLGTGALPGPGLHPPGLQPHLERLDLEVDTAVGIRLQRRQGAHGRRQQREGLQQSQEHHEELQARQRLAQAHARPAAKCQCAGVRTRLQEAVCGRAEGPTGLMGRPLHRHPPPQAPAPPRTRPELVRLLPDGPVQVGTLEVKDNDHALKDVVAEDAEG